MSIQGFPDCLGQGPVSRKPQKHFDSQRHFLVNLYLTTEKCTRLNSCMEGTSLHKYYEYKTALCDKEGNFAIAFQMRKPLGTFEKQDPVILSVVIL